MTLAMSALLVMGAGFKFAIQDNATELSSALIAKIVDENYVHRQVPVLVQAEGDTSQKDMFNEVGERMQFLRVVQFDPVISGYKSWFYVVYYFENYSAFENKIEIFGSNRFDLFGYYTIVYRQVSDIEIISTFDALWRLRITRAVIVVVDPVQPQLYNYSPYSDAKCGSPNVQRIKLPTSVKLFEHRLNDFHGCQLLLGTFESLPFVHFLPSLENRTSVVGFEGKLVSTISEKLNFMLKFVDPPDGAQWGVPRRNGSTGLMKILQEETVHFGVGCLGLIADRNEILQPGTPHYATGVVFAVPDGHSYGAFEKLFRPLDRTTWILLWSFSGIAGLTVFILKFAPDAARDLVYGLNNRIAYLNTVGVFFAGATLNVPKRNFARSLLILWIFYCFVLRTVYQGSMFKYLQAESNHKPVETVGEVEDSDLYYYMLKISERFFVNNSRILSRVRNIQPGNDTLNAFLDDIAMKKLRNGVVMVTSEHIAFHNKYRLDKGFVRSTRDYVVSYPMVIYYPKRSFLIREFDRVIGRIQMAGLMSYWVQRYGNYDFFPKEINDIRPVAMNIAQLVGCLESCAVLWVASFAIFLLELLSTKVPCIRNILEFLADK